MEIYNLCNKQANSNQYYQTIEKMTQVVKQDLLKAMQEEIAAYQEYIRKAQLEDVRTDIEYGLELLLLGVLWETYGQNITDLKSLICWLEETGEYDEEVIRLQQWQSFLENEKFLELEVLKEKLIMYARRFKEKVEAHLAPYITNVKSFRSQRAEYYKERKDYIFCMQPPIMYYLNMIGAQLLNEAYREAFIGTSKKVIFLPGCMPYRNQGKCQAVLNKGVYLCQGCSANCQVHQIAQMAQTYQAKAMVLYHESDLNKQKLKEHEGQVGVIGVACVLSLLSGGFKAKRLGYVPQCVLLDYCGCKQHWDENGIVTQINLQQIKKILDGSIK